MEDKILEIEQFGWINPGSGGLILTTYEDDEEDIMYVVTLLVNLDDESEEGHFVHIPTQIESDVKLAACQMGINLLAMIVGEDAIINHVVVFDDNGEEVEQFDLEEAFKQEMIKSPRVLH